MISFHHKIIREIELRSCFNASGSVNDRDSKKKKKKERKWNFFALTLLSEDRKIFDKMFFLFHIYTI